MQKLTDNTNDYDIDVSNDIIDLSYISDTSLSLLFQRNFDFNFNLIFNEIKVEVNEYTGFDGTSGNSDNNDISFVNFTSM